MFRHLLKVCVARSFRLVLAVSVASLTGCGQGFEADSIEAKLEEVDTSGKFEVPIDKPVCEVDFADYEIDTKLLAFQMTDKFNIDFGFDLLSGFFRALGLSIKLKSGKMASRMTLRETLRTSTSVAVSLGEGKAKEKDFRISLNAVQLGADIGYYSRTPLFKLSEKTLKNNLGNLRKELSAVETPWQSKVVWKKDNFNVIIPSGTVSGLRLGDQLKLYQMKYVWKDIPCESELIMATKEPNMPIAYGEIVQIEKNASYLQIYDSISDAPIEAGTIVEAHVLKQKDKKDKRELKRSVRIAAVESEKLKVPSVTDSNVLVDVDMTIYIRDQLAAILSEYGFYPRE